MTALFFFLIAGKTELAVKGAFSNMSACLGLCSSARTCMWLFRVMAWCRCLRSVFSTRWRTHFNGSSCRRVSVRTGFWKSEMKHFKQGCRSTYFCSSPILWTSRCPLSSRKHTMVSNSAPVGRFKSSKGLKKPCCASMPSFSIESLQNKSN